MNSTEAEPGIELDQVHVWIISGRDYQQREPGIEQRLSSEETVRADRFKNESHAAQWAFFHAALRDILSNYTGQAAEQLQFRLGEHGKPCLLEAPSPALHFNLSHSGDLALLAVTRCAPIGVDIEHQRELNDMDALVTRFFSAAEQRSFARLAPTNRRDCFYHCWTRKEALIKANGIGLSAPLAAFDVPLESIDGWHAPAVRPPLPANTGYPLWHIELEPGYVGAVALELPDTECSNLPRVELLEYTSGLRAESAHVV